MLALVKQLRPQVEIPLLLMGYANPYFALGVDGFVAEAAAAGVDGIICPDLPPEEGADLYGALEKARHRRRAARRADHHARAPRAARAPHARLPLLRVAHGCHRRAGDDRAGRRGGRARRARALADVPVCVGFGVSTPAQAAEIGRYADGVVVGGALVDRIERAKSRDAAVSDVARFVAELKAPLRRIR